MILLFRNVYLGDQEPGYRYKLHLRAHFSMVEWTGFRIGCSSAYLVWNGCSTQAPQSISEFVFGVTKDIGELSQNPELPKKRKRAIIGVYLTFLTVDTFLVLGDVYNNVYKQIAC